MTDRFEPRDDATFETLGQALPRVAPSDDLFERILAATRLDAAAEPRAATTRQRRRRRWLPLAAAAAAGAAAAAAVTVGLESGGGTGAPSATASPSRSAGSRITGQAALYHPDEPGGKIRLRLSDVPLPPRGSHYELWLLPKGSTQMTAVASFTPASNTVDLLLPLPAPDDYAAFDISVQENNGSPERSRVNLTSGSFTSSQ